MNTQEWLKAKLHDGEETEAEIPPAGQSVVLYLCPHERMKPWEADIGSLYVAKEDEKSKAEALFWGSAFGIHSPFDGVKFKDILKKYTVCFTEVPPLEYGRFPAPLGISHGAREGFSRTNLRRVLDSLE